MRDRLSTRALLIAAVFALLMASFAVGGLVYALGKRGGGDVEENRSQVAKNIGRTERDFPQLILVPEADSSSTIGQSITSAPIPDPDHKVPSEFQRSDATALPSSEYSRLLEQSRRGESQSQPPASVDPRTVKTPQPGAASPPPPPPSDS